MKLLKLNSKNYQKVFKEMVVAIKDSRVIVCPTDTVYGLICDATNKKAVEKVFQIKKRPKNKPIPIFVKDIKMAKKIAKIDKKQEKILKSVWPGKVTCALKRKKLKLYGVDKKTIALRIPNYKLILDLIEKTKIPLSGTSANISKKPASTKIKEVIKQLANQKYQPELVIDAGNLSRGRPSIVLDLIPFPPKILRK